ncbi:hypothetical protein Tco_0766869 [Tanacetum coccineum]
MLIGDTGSKVQQEIAKEFATMMASGTVCATEAAALATNKMVQKYMHMNVTQTSYSYGIDAVSCRKAHLLEDKQIPSVEVFDEESLYTLFRVAGDDVTSIKRRRHDLSSDGVRILATTSGRGLLKEDLESSMWRRQQVKVDEVVHSGGYEHVEYGDGEEFVEHGSGQQVQYDVNGINSSCETQNYDESSEDACTDDDDDGEDADILVDEENKVVEPNVDVHLFGITKDVPFDNIYVTNLVPEHVLEGEDVDVVNVEGFDSNTGYDDERQKFGSAKEAKDIVY